MKTTFVLLITLAIQTASAQSGFISKTLSWPIIYSEDMVVSPVGWTLSVGNASTDTISIVSEQLRMKSGGGSALARSRAISVEANQSYFIRVYMKGVTGFSNCYMRADSASSATAWGGIYRPDALISWDWFYGASVTPRGTSMTLYFLATGTSLMIIDSVRVYKISN